MIKRIFHNIDYRIICEEKREIKVLCHEKDYAYILEAFFKEGYIKLIHPLSKKNGYKYAYQLTEFLLFQKNDVMIEIYFELPCFSLTPEVLLPLDKYIQETAWEKICVYEGRAYLIPQVQLVYMIADAIFNKKEFTDNTCLWIKKNCAYIRDELTYQMLYKVFFKFTDSLIDKIEEGRYADIFFDYITFRSY